MTGFIVIMAHAWDKDPALWQDAGKLPKYLLSVSELVPTASFHAAVNFALTLCFCLFAYTCLVGMISFSEIAAAVWEKSEPFHNGARPCPRCCPFRCSGQYCGL